MPRCSDTTKTDTKTGPKPRPRGRRPKNTQPDTPALVIDIPDTAPTPSEATPESPAGTIGFAPELPSEVWRQILAHDSSGAHFQFDHEGNDLGVFGLPTAFNRETRQLLKEAEDEFVANSCGVSYAEFMENQPPVDPPRDAYFFTPPSSPVGAKDSSSNARDSGPCFFTPPPSPRVVVATA